jgi:hypothetical protein
VFTKENQQIPNIKRKKKKKKKIRSRSDQIRSRSRSDQIRSDQIRSDQIRSRFDPLDRDRCRDARRAFAVASVRRWLRCDGDGGFGASREIGERESEVASVDGDGGGGFGASREIGERESEVARGCWGAREKARWLGVLGVARGLARVARDSERESREQRVRRERAEMREMGRSRAPSRVLENGLRKNFSVNHFPFFPLLFYGQKQIFSV